MLKEKRQRNEYLLHNCCASDTKLGSDTYHDLLIPLQDEQRDHWVYCRGLEIGSDWPSTHGSKATEPKQKARSTWFQAHICAALSSTGLRPVSELGSWRKAAGQCKQGRAVTGLTRDVKVLGQPGQGRMCFLHYCLPNSVLQGSLNLGARLAAWSACLLP